MTRTLDILMNWKNLLYRLAIKKGLSRPYPQLIPTSLPGSAANNFFVVELRDPSSTARQITIQRDVDSTAYECLYFANPTANGYPASVLKASLHQYRFGVRYYCKGYEFRCDNAGLFLIQIFFHYWDFLIFWDRLRQRLFNRRKLVRHDRIAVLKLFVERTMWKRDYAVSSPGLFQDIHTYRGFNHPQRDEMLQYYGLILDSFRQSGDLTLDGPVYKLTGKGVASLSSFEMEERRFKENLRQQRAVVWLTFVIVGVGLLQAAATWFAPTK
ncbi:hypothetical protein ACU8OR_25360 (plasmid) [Rhizobium leguminosarum]